MSGQNRTMEDALQQRSRNLELMKLFAAWLVIVHHSFDLNLAEGEWIKVITRGQLDFGTMAVSLFFLASGIFIAKSIEKNHTGRAFFKARLVRLWPPLMLTVILTVVMGAIVSSLPLKEYLLLSETRRYLLNGIFVLQHGLPGVFEHNIYGNAVNGALWTLPVEVACYVACYVIYRMGLLKKGRILAVMVVYLVCTVIGMHVCSVLGMSLLVSAFRPCYFFLLGHVIYVYRDKIPVKWSWFIAALAGMGVCFAFAHHILSVIAIWVCYPYVLMYLAFMGHQCSKNIAYGGRFSYTIYLCAFPIQQLLIDRCGGIMSVYANLGGSLVIATAIGALLYYGTSLRKGARA